MARLILFLVSITSFIVFLTVAFQNFPNDAKFFFLTDIDWSRQPIIFPMIISFVMGLITGGAAVGATLVKGENDEDYKDTAVADGWE